MLRMAEISKLQEVHGQTLTQIKVVLLFTQLHHKLRSSLVQILSLANLVHLYPIQRYHHRRLQSAEHSILRMQLEVLLQC